MSTGPWCHAICCKCWDKKNPERLTSPHHHATDALSRAGDPSCCFCSSPTCVGIWVREDPKLIPCTGVHAWDGGAK